MKTEERNNRVLFLFSSLLLSAGFAVDALSYDYSFNSECLKNPEKPLYGGGIVENPELKEGLKGWSSFGNAKIEKRGGGNEYIVASSRRRSHDSFSQKFFVENGKFYSFSAWVQTSPNGNGLVAAIFKTPTGFEHVGWVDAKAGCWSMLKGGLNVNYSGPAELYFECNDTSVDIWADSISLQPFTKEEWRSHQDQSIEKNRKSRVKLQAVDVQGNPLPNASVSINLLKPNFPFGNAINKNILTNTAYQNWFTSRFKVTTFENEMKWYTNEPNQGKEDYSAADALLQFAQQHRISVRGHNVLWDDPHYQPGWVNSLSPSQLRPAVQKRMTSIMKRYSGKVIGWDVVNENMHFNFFESKLGWNASGAFYRVARVLDGRAGIFLNEFNTIEEPHDGAAAPAKYLAKLKEIWAAGFRGPLSIGLEGHFGNPDLAYVRSAIDTLASAKVPIWITELDVTSGPQQATFLEKILKEAFAHPAISGIVMWASWTPQGCYRMCLTDNNFKNLPTGDVVDKLIWHSLTLKDFKGTTDAEGYFEAPLIHGDYQVTVTHPHIQGPSLAQGFKVTSMGDSQNHLHVKVTV